ncbi:MAG: DUF1016 N-terminal domain-containing protein [Candidatus Omnitrophota bacterium]
MPALPGTTRAYDDLVDTLESALTSGLTAARRALEYQRLKTYWQIGRSLNMYIKRFPEAAARGNAFFRRVSSDLRRKKDLNISPDTISRAAHFHNVYPVFPRKTPLTFSHYLVLLSASDTSRRRRLERRAVREGLTVARLKQEAALLGLESVQPDRSVAARRLTVIRGEPFVYYICSRSDLNRQKVPRIDCGFKTYKSIPAGNDRIPAPGTIVRVKKRDGAYILRAGQKARVKRYTYQARVTRVVDGDTMLAEVDLGFGIWIVDRFRLRGIDAPELTESAGRRAKAFLERYFSDCPCIVIRNTKEGAYGRWLADIFVLKGEGDPYRIAREGEYLNQILLDKGLAKIY